MRIRLDRWPRDIAPSPLSRGEGWGEGYDEIYYTLTLALSLKGEGKRMYLNY